MFQHTYIIKMADTDAAGILYFAQQFRIAHETYEAFWAARGLSFGQLVQTASYFVPIVHAEGDYKTPLFVGDTLSIDVSVGHIGHTSFRIDYTFTKQTANGPVFAGSVQTVHVAIDRKTRQKIALPEELKHILDI